MKKTFSTVTVIMFALMMLFVSCDGANSGVPSEGAPSIKDIRTKSDLMASIPGVLIPPSSGTKNPDESIVSLVSSVLDRLNRDYNGESYKEETISSQMALFVYEGDSANGYVFGEAKYLSVDEYEAIYNGTVTSNGNVIVFDNAKYKGDTSTDQYPESGSVTVNGKSVSFEYAGNLLPEDSRAMKGEWTLNVNRYRSGTYSVFSGVEFQDNYHRYFDDIVVLDIATSGHMVQIKYTCPSKSSSFRYNSDCKLDYVAVDGSFYNIAKIKDALEYNSQPTGVRLSSTLMEFATIAEVQGRNLQLEATIDLKNGGTSKDVVWETPEDTNAFKVQSTSDGVLTFQIYKSGTYVISAHADYEGKHFKTAQCVITINDALTQLRIYDATNDNTFTGANATIELLKGQTVELSPIYTPSSTSQLDVLWSVDNASVAILSGKPNYKATLTAIGPGNATVTLMSQENTNIKQTLNVIVRDSED